MKQISHIRLKAPEFKCPRCGSKFFSSSLDSNGGVAKRFCKGLIREGSYKDYLGCDFQWNPEDDSRYGL